MTRNHYSSRTPSAGALLSAVVGLVLLIPQLARAEPSSASTAWVDGTVVSFASNRPVPGATLQQASTEIIRDWRVAG